MAIGIAAVLLAAGAYVYAMLRPTEARPASYMRFEKATPLAEALGRLQSAGFLRSSRFTLALAILRREQGTVQPGTYAFRGGLQPMEVIERLRKPIRQMVRLPEGWWIARTAERLEAREVCKREDYISLASQAGRFADVLPALKNVDSLEGLLYPDTYDLPPLLGAEGVIRRQLTNLKSKVGPDFFKTENWHKVLNIAAMVEAETQKDDEKPIVAGVIYNRLAKRMRLQIDATALYALQEWKQLKPGEIAKIDSPYNTYRIDGLPPGPICSPGLASIRAAQKPEKHEYLYYVAMPGGRHRFAKTYEEHLKNIRVSRAAFAAQGGR
jgi:UPF0755 protein